MIIIEKEQGERFEEMEDLQQKQLQELLSLDSKKIKLSEVIVQL